MHAVVMERFGPPEVLQYREVPDPEPGPGEVVVEVHAVSINRSLDLGVRADGDGRSPVLPLVLGTDPSGIVAKVGAGVTQWSVGQRVAVKSPVPCGVCAHCLGGEDCPDGKHVGVHFWGGYAEQVVVPERAVLALPTGVSFPEATVIMRHYPTAYYLLVVLAGLRAGERVLIMGATGGLGSAGVEVAKLIGAEVIAGVGSDAKAEVALKMGADHAINYRASELDVEVAKATNGAGVDVVFENISDPVLWPKAFVSLARNGRLVTAGSFGGPIVGLDVRRLYSRRLQIIGGAGSDAASRAWTVEAATAGQLHPLIGEVFPLREAQHAHEVAERGDLIGKVILEPHPATS